MRIQPLRLDAKLRRRMLYATSDKFHLHAIHWFYYVKLAVILTFDS